MKVLIHYGDRIEEAMIDCPEAPAAPEAPKVIELELGRADLYKVKAFLSGKADGFPLYRFAS